MKTNRIAAVLTACVLALGLIPLTAPAASATTLVYKVTNYDNDGTKGVYLRNSANVSDVNRVSSRYVTYGTSVQLICAAWGSAVGSHANTAWDYVKVLGGSNSGATGYISEHWLNTPVGANQHVSGEPACGTSSTPKTTAATTKAINYATARLGSTSYNGLCLKFVREAWASGSVDIRSQISIAWGSNTYPKDVWGHFKAGTTGTGTPPAGALVFFTSGANRAYSHVTIAVDSSRNTISTNDSVDKRKVHRESLAQRAASGAYAKYVGWWLPKS